MVFSGSWKQSIRWMPNIEYRMPDAQSVLCMVYGNSGPIFATRQRNTNRSYGETGPLIRSINQPPIPVMPNYPQNDYLNRQKFLLHEDPLESIEK